MRKIFLKFFVVSVFCCLTMSCSNSLVETDSGSIFGVVTDFATGEPVQNANVQLQPSGETVLTGYDGTYEFIDIPDGEYSITVSKAEYTDLVDDYIIEVKNGKRLRRDAQIVKKPTSIRITDMNGNNISVLDYGSDVSMVNKSFNIFNNGTVSINCQLVYSCKWISSVSSIPESISSGQTVPVIVKINRALLSEGLNTTTLTVSTNNGSAEIMLKATSTSGNPPKVQMYPINSSDITATSVLCEGNISDANGGEIKERGFCYGVSSNPSLDDHVISLGSGIGSFTYTIINLEPNTTYHIRAFATSNLGVGYSSDYSFKTVSGLPTCKETTITMLDPTSVMGESSVSGNGYEIINHGFCWSTKRNPTINDQKVENGFVLDGPISAIISSLKPSTTYWVRAYAKTEFGISYGQETDFTTLSGLATVSTKSAVLSGDEVITGGTVINTGGATIFDRGVCYGSNPNPDISGEIQWDALYGNDYYKMIMRYCT